MVKYLEHRVDDIRILSMVLIDQKDDFPLIRVRELFS